MLDFDIKADTSLGQELLARGLSRFSLVLDHVRNLPYGRNSDRSRPELVWPEGKGTCSSKHAFLKQVADAHGQDDLKLVVGMYRMTRENTPGIGNALADVGLDFVPEAHCYLKLGEEALDVTSAQADFERIRSALLEEREIEWEQVGKWKVEYHRKFVEKWIEEEGIELSFEEVWTAREQCIANLTD